MAVATTQLVMPFGQWTQIAGSNSEPILSPMVKDWRMLVRYQSGDPGVGEVDGHIVSEETCAKCMECAPSATLNIWARPIYPEADMEVTITRI